MDESDSDLSDITLPYAPATSVLGTKGSLRFRPHGTTQKPHVVLKRVEAVDYMSLEDGGGERENVAYFSIFALKRIECKPGKEILLSVASPDGRFGDRAVIFESNLVEEDAGVAGDKEMDEELGDVLSSSPPAGKLFPPRLRMRMIGKPDYHAPHRPMVDAGVQVSPGFVSSAVQAQPAMVTQTVQAGTSTSTASASVQAQPELQSTASQAGPELTSTSIQASAATASRLIQACPKTHSIPVQAAPSSAAASVQVTPRMGDFSSQAGHTTRYASSQTEASDRSISVQVPPSPQTASTQIDLPPVSTLPSAPQRVMNSQGTMNKSADERPAPVPAASHSQAMKPDAMVVCMPSPGLGSLPGSAIQCPIVIPAPLQPKPLRSTRSPSPSSIASTRAPSPTLTASVSQLPARVTPRAVPTPPPSQPKAMAAIINRSSAPGAKGLPTGPRSLRGMEDTPTAFSAPKPIADPDAPPPSAEAQPLMFTSNGPMGNSLAIRPSLPGQVPPAPPSASASATAPGTRKKLVIANGWPRVKQNGAGTGSSVKSPSLSPLTSVASPPIPPSAPPPLPPPDQRVAIPHNPPSVPDPPPPPPETAAQDGKKTKTKKKKKKKDQVIEEEPLKLIEVTRSPPSRSASSSAPQHPPTASLAALPAAAALPTSTPQPSSPSPAVHPPKQSPISIPAPEPQLTSFTSAPIPIPYITSDLLTSAPTPYITSDLLTSAPTPFETWGEPSLSPVASTSSTSHNAPSSHPPAATSSATAVAAPRLPAPLHPSLPPRPSFALSSSSRGTVASNLHTSTQAGPLASSSTVGVKRDRDYSPTGSSAHSGEPPRQRRRTRSPDPGLRRRSRSRDRDGVDLRERHWSPGYDAYDRGYDRDRDRPWTRSRSRSRSRSLSSTPRLRSRSRSRSRHRDDGRGRSRTRRPYGPSPSSSRERSRLRGVERSPLYGRDRDRDRRYASTDSSRERSRLRGTVVDDDWEMEREREGMKKRRRRSVRSSSASGDRSRSRSRSRSRGKSKRRAQEVPVPVPSEKEVEKGEKKAKKSKGKDKNKPSVSDANGKFKPLDTDMMELDRPDPANAKAASVPSQATSSAKTEAAEPLDLKLPAKPAQASAPKPNGSTPPVPPAPPVSSLPKQPNSWPIVKPTHTAQVRVGKTKDTPGAPIRSISISSDGNMIAIRCADKTIRIWSNRNHLESAKLHNKSDILYVSWMLNDVGVIVFDASGIVSQWLRKGQNLWEWRKLLDVSADVKNEECGPESVSFAYRGDKVAIAFPSFGVKLWMWTRGIWAAQRSVARQHVTALAFIESGSALLGGTKDGALWHCSVPNGSLRAHAFFPSKITKLAVDATGRHALVSTISSHTTIMDTNKDTGDRALLNPGGGVPPPPAGEGVTGFVSLGGAVLAERVGKSPLVWLNKTVSCQLDHDEDEIRAVCCHDTGKDGYVLTGTEEGRLSWWSARW